MVSKVRSAWKVFGVIAVEAVVNVVGAIGQVDDFAEQRLSLPDTCSRWARSTT